MESSRNVAIYLDFENLAISAETVYPSRDKPLDIGPLVDYATTKGVICSRKAYADWSKDIFAQYQNRLMDQGFELIHLPETNLQGKNGSDVRLAVDVMEYMEFFPEIDTLLIGSGDTDFIPLIQRLRTKGKSVVVVGFEHSVGTLVKRNSDEFKALEDLIGAPEEESPSFGLSDEPTIAKGRNLLIRYIRSSSNKDEPILMSQLKQQLLRLDPSFSEKEMGFSSFKQFILSLLDDVVEKVEIEDNSLPVVYLQEPPKEDEPIRLNSKETAGQFLTKKLRYQRESEKRLAMSQSLFDELRKDEELSMSQMFELVHDIVRPKLAKTDVKKYINTLFTGGAFVAKDNRTNGPLLSRPFRLDDSIESTEGMDQVYIRRISEILQSRYTDLETQEILELLI